jgi:hypothetical protein
MIQAAYSIPLYLAGPGGCNGRMVSPILANGISGEGFLILGVVFGALPLAVIVLIEWPIWRAVAGLQGKPVLKICLRANVFSAVLAIPLAILLDAQSSHFVNTDLHRYERTFLLYAVVRYAIYLALSIAVEGFVFALQFPSVGKRRILRGAMCANVLSYVIISPVYYQLTKPSFTGAQFTADTSWAPESSQRVTYIDATTRHLVSCDLRGGDRRTLVDAPMDSYLLLPDRAAAVYMRGSELWWAKGEAKKRITDALPAERGASMVAFDLDRSRGLVAYASVTGSGARPFEETYDIHVWEPESGADRVVQSGLVGWGGPIVRWADQGHHLRIRKWYNDSPDKELLVAIDGSDAGDQKSPSDRKPLTGCLAPLGRDNSRQRPDQIEFADQRDDWHVTSWSVLTNRYASVARGAKWMSENSVETMTLADNPGIYLVWARVREWADFAFVPATQVAVLEDQTNRVLYLVDPVTGRVGKLAEGSDFVLNRTRYLRGVSDGGLGPWAPNPMEMEAATQPR